MRDIDTLFAALYQSEFRSRFKLKPKEYNYLQEKGMEVILQHAHDFIDKRLAPASIPNDGKQTPMRNHPVFIAQHATATCCRNCLQKWHFIEKGKSLNEEEKNYIVNIIKTWLNQQLH